MSDIRRELIEAARRIGPMLREQGLRAEHDRRLPREVIRALSDAGLQRMLLPRSLGGHEIDPVTCARVVEEVAGFDTSAAWALQSGNTGAWWAARLPAAGVEEIYGSGRDVIMAASFHPPQQATQVEGGHRINGRGPLASNVHDSEWLLLSALVMEDGRPKMNGDMPVMIAFVIQTKEVQIVDTWDSLGLRGSDSNDVAMDNVFVPASRTYRLVPEYERGAHFQGPLYRFPAMGQVGLIITPVLLATARGALDELHELAERKTPFGGTKTLREKHAVQAAVARAEGMLRAARSLYYEALGAAWEHAQSGEPFTLAQKADVLLAQIHATQTAANVVERMHRLAGTSAIYKRNRLERHFRDVETLRHHGFVAEGRYETVGQVYLGLQPEFGLVAF
jgi:alkylation response protein AidB-like acyl-CoA dehydrogenase